VERAQPAEPETYLLDDVAEPTNVAGGETRPWTSKLLALTRDLWVMSNPNGVEEWGDP